MSAMSGGIASPRPWTLADRQPPIVVRSAPAGFCAKLHCLSRPRCPDTRNSYSRGHCTPASTSIVPRSASKSITWLSLRLSISTPSRPNCCAPIAWRPPAMQIARSSRRAKRNAPRTPSRESGSRILKTSVELSCAWTSFTTKPSGLSALDLSALDLGLGLGLGCGQAVPGHAAATPAAPRNLRRLIMAEPYSIFRTWRTMPARLQRRVQYDSHACRGGFGLDVLPVACAGAGLERAGRKPALSFQVGTRRRARLRQPHEEPRGRAARRAPHQVGRGDRAQPRARARHGDLRDARLPAASQAHRHECRAQHARLERGDRVLRDRPGRHAVRRLRASVARRFALQLLQDEPDRDAHRLLHAELAEA